MRKVNEGRVAATSIVRPVTIKAVVSRYLGAFDSLSLLSSMLAHTEKSEFQFLHQLATDPGRHFLFASGYRRENYELYLAKKYGEKWTQLGRDDWTCVVSVNCNQSYLTPSNCMLTLSFIVARAKFFTNYTQADHFTPTRAPNECKLVFVLSATLSQSALGVSLARKLNLEYVGVSPDLRKKKSPNAALFRLLQQVDLY